jgi:hypothetical protein
MLAIIGYLLLAISLQALAKLAHSKKGRLWDWIGYGPFFASMIFSVAFGTALIQWIPHPVADSMQGRMILDLVGIVVFITVGCITSYVAGGVLFSHAMAYAKKRRGELPEPETLPEPWAYKGQVNYLDTPEIINENDPLLDDVDHLRVTDLLGRPLGNVADVDR